MPPSSDPWDTLWNVHVMQFRDSLGKRFWIAWQPWAAGWWQWAPSTMKVPARADTVDTCGVDIDGFPDVGIDTAATTGWFAKQFDTFPVIVRERENFSRPDVVVDSVRMMPSPLAIGHPATAHVYFHNAGSDTTPISGPLSTDYTWVVLAARWRLDSSGRVPTHAQTRKLWLHFDTRGFGAVGLARYGAVRRDRKLRAAVRRAERDG